LARDIVDEKSMKSKFQNAGKNVSQSISTFLGRSAHISPSTSSTYLSQLASSETSTANNAAPKEVSPIFIQFLECMIQIMRRHPSKFQYSEGLIRLLAEHAYSCQFGDFLFNNQKERSEFIFKMGPVSQRLEQCTVSIWDYVYSRNDEFLNPEFTFISNLGSETEDILDINTSQLYYWTAELLFDSGIDNRIHEIDSLNLKKAPSVKYVS
jgi:hypothetical protein